jgi:hypothetical protein
VIDVGGKVGEVRIDIFEGGNEESGTVANTSSVWSVGSYLRIEVAELEIGVFTILYFLASIAGFVEADHFTLGIET